MFTQIFALIIIAFLLLFLVVFIIFEIYTVFISHYKGAPFVPSAEKKKDAMLKLAAIRPRDVVIDLGSGSGTLLFDAAKKYYANAVGIEINPFLVLFSRYRIRRYGLSQWVTVHYADFRTYSLSDADVVFLYLWPSTIEKLKEKFTRELKPGARIVSNTFRIQGWEPVKEENGVFLYRI